MKLVMCSEEGAGHQEATIEIEDLERLASSVQASRGYNS